MYNIIGLLLYCLSLCAGVPYGSECSVTSDCQLGHNFVCESSKCACSTSYVFDKRKGTCKKICRGSSEGLVKHGTAKEQYKLYKNKYTNCTYVEGNLELANLIENFDLGFLKDIKQVNGYVLIVNVFSNYLNLTNLRIIRGQTLFKHAKEDYSLYVALNHNPKNNLEGLYELQLRSLTEIMRGKVYFHNNNLLCYVSTIKWNDINPGTNPPFQVVFNSRNYRRQCTPCSDTCLNKYTGELHCWGEGKDMCQKLNYLKPEVCSPACDGRCFGPTSQQCCHEQCASGCFGPRITECVTCKNFYNDGECLQYCPKKINYDQTLMKWVPNPNGRYSFGSLCVQQCLFPDVINQDACVIKCPMGKHPDKVTNECMKCESACPKRCPGISDDDMFLHANNLAQFNECTIVEGNLRILRVTFVGDEQGDTQGITLDDLKILKDIKDITGYLTIQEAPAELKNLSFLSGLETIHGRWLTQGLSFSVLSMPGIKWLGLTSLKYIRNGNVAVAWNERLCFIHGLDMYSLLEATSIQKFKHSGNEDRATCDAEGMKCHAECSHHGCWGPGPAMCLRCRSMRRAADNLCLASCMDEPLLWEGDNDRCYDCHEQCAVGCMGLGPTECIECKNVAVLGANNTRECMEECPIPLEPPRLYPDENRVCQQCNLSCVDGCTGPSSQVITGGCVACNLAINRTDMNHSVHCLPHDQNYCPDGYYVQQFRSLIADHPLNKHTVCQPCNHLCLTCSTPGNANCPACRYVKHVTELSTFCIEKCPFQAFALSGVCTACNGQCLDGCYGPNATHCAECKKFKIILSHENNTLECVDECPSELPNLVEDLNPDKPTRTVCAGDDHPEVVDARNKDKETEKILTIVIPVSCSVIALGILLALFWVCWRRKQRAKKNRLKLTARMTGVVEAEAVCFETN